MKKIQLPSIGGIRKVITVGDAAVGTTIAEIGSNTITLAQLANALGVPAVTNPSGTSAPAGGAGAPASILVGPGLSGGGPLLGPAVPIRLTAPIPVLYGEDGEEGAIGPPGINGIIGKDGAQGQAIYLEAEAGEDGMMIPGVPGPPGSTGPAALTLTDGTNTVAGVTQITAVGGTVSGSTPNAVLTISGGGGGNVTPDSHPSIPTGVGLGPNDEFEGAALDTAGTRYAGATAWTWFNQLLATAVLTQGSLAIQTGGVSSHQNGIGQPAPVAPWTYQCKMQGLVPGATCAIGFMVRDTANNKQFQIGLLIASGAISFIWSTLTADIFVANTTAGWAANTPLDATLLQTFPTYFQLAFASSSFTFSASRSGVAGTFTTIFTVSLAASGLTNVNTIGLSVVSGTVGNTNLVADWFRRVA